jgi:hypothetical protein
MPQNSLWQHCECGPIVLMYVAYDAAFVKSLSRSLSPQEETLNES